jgi:SAM-dependent methyltransferase
MATLYGPHYASLWASALLEEGHDDLFASLASEYARHAGVSQEAAEQRLEEAWRCAGERWWTAFPRTRDAAALNAYYSSGDGIAESLYWHSLRPNAYALHSVAGLHAVQQLAEGADVYEHGHGVGSTALLFARSGFRLTLGDVSSAYREFARGRLERRDVRAEFLDLEREAPSPGSFDAAVSFDVLEHVPDPLGEVRKLHAALRPGGVLVLNVAFGLDASNPEHLLERRRGFVDRIRAVGFERVASSSLLVFYKRPVSPARAALYRALDLREAVADDVVASIPALTVLRARRVPPVAVP